MGHLITVTRPDDEGEFPAYCAEPFRVSQSAIIVIQEIFGVNAGVLRGTSAMRLSDR